MVFTSGGSESNHHALKGVFFANRERGDHFITSAVEHPAVVQPLRVLEALGARVTALPVDRQGRADPDDVRRALAPRTLLASIMHANDEVGTMQPIAEIAAIARELFRELDALPPDHVCGWTMAKVLSSPSSSALGAGLSTEGQRAL